MTWEPGTTGWDNWLGPNSMCVGKNFTFADALHTNYNQALSPCPSFSYDASFLACAAAD